MDVRRKKDKAIVGDGYRQEGRREHVDAKK